MKSKSKAKKATKTLPKATKKSVAPAKKKTIAKTSVKAKAVKKAKPTKKAIKAKTVTKKPARVPAKKQIEFVGPKIGLFGGSFNPFHIGHIASLESVLKSVGLSKIFVIPSYQNPLKTATEGPTAEQRSEMVQSSLQSYVGEFEIDNREIQRAGTTYTIDTIESYLTEYNSNQLFFIVGADLLDQLARWHRMNDLLAKTNFIVTTRPGFQIPESTEELPAFIRDSVKTLKDHTAILKTGRTIRFVTIPDVKVSATEIRKKARGGQPLSGLVHPEVADYIKSHGFYKDLNQKIFDYGVFTKSCAQLLFDKKAVNLKGYDLSKENGITDYVLITSGTSTRHTTSLAENLIQHMKDNAGIRPLSVEGLNEGRWVVVDYGSLIIHIFYDYVRQEYRLEELWKKGLEIPLKDQMYPVSESNA